MKCGNCHQDHETVAEVRSCYGPRAARQPGDNPNTYPNVTPKTITQPKTTKGTFNDVPAGHYAVESKTGNNDLDFYRVDAPKGQWAGFKFVKVIIGGHPDYAVRGAKAIEVLTRIREATPAKAAERYGQEIGRCYRCNRHLTDETSRALGIGPECRKMS